MIWPFFILWLTNSQFFMGAILSFPVIVGLWYSNTWNTGYLPINSNHVFDNTGSSYNVSNAVGSNTLFNQTLYENYSPAYLAAGNLVIYGGFFAVYTATLSHAILYHRHEIAHGFRSLISRKKTSEVHKDVHVRLMLAYKEVPEWQYLAVLVIAIGLGAAGVGVYPTQTSPAVVLYGVFLAVIFVLPIGIILAITNVPITLNVLAELFGGLWFPGNAVAMNYFKSYGYVTTAHTLNFAQDLKLAHYMHIAPVHTFWAQIYATVVSSFVCIGILNFQMTKINGVCSPDQINHFTCPGINTFFTASVLWGTLGPKRMFGAGGIYNSLLYCFLIGAVLPVPFYVLRKRFKTFEYVHVPVVLAGTLTWAPYNLSNVWPAVPIAYVFNVYVKKRYIAWWSKYNYVTTTAFSAAVAISAVVIFFALEWPQVEINWSGNTRPFDGCDGEGCPRLAVPNAGFFGPGPGEFH
ncbi:oligopeptide transporter 4 [Mycena crocata]|nr:oligopeptide transporter 4 [Mycena crocata]